MKRCKRPTADAVATVRRAVTAARAEGRPIGVLFVCLGNICRSPAAQGVMERLAESAGVADRFSMDSAGFYGGHRGDLPDSRMRRAAKARGMELTHRSRTVRTSDFDDFDIIIGMDDRNIDDLHDAAPSVEAESKILRMIDFATGHDDYDSVPDPYWSGSDGFELVLDLLEDACGNLLSETLKADYED